MWGWEGGSVRLTDVSEDEVLEPHLLNGPGGIEDRPVRSDQHGRLPFGVALVQDLGHARHPPDLDAWTKGDGEDEIGDRCDGGSALDGGGGGWAVQDLWSNDGMRDAVTNSGSWSRRCVGVVTTGCDCAVWGCGVTCGAGLFILASASTALILFMLTLYRYIEDRIERPGRHEDVDDY